MISHISEEKMTAREVLKTYKELYGVEQNFSFLKEPLIGNDTFLKKAFTNRCPDIHSIGESDDMEPHPAEVEKPRRSSQW